MMKIIRYRSSFRPFPSLLFFNVITWAYKVQTLCICSTYSTHLGAICTPVELDPLSLKYLVFWKPLPFCHSATARNEVWILIFMLLVANQANTKWCKEPEKWLKPWHMGTHLRVLSESYPVNTNITRFRWFSTIVGFLTVLWTKEASAMEGLMEIWMIMRLILSLRAPPVCTNWVWLTNCVLCHLYVPEAPPLIECN